MGFENRKEAGKEYLVQKVENPSELDDVAINMLQNNDIKGILPFLLIQENNSIELRYDISEYEICSGKVNQKKLLKLLRAIRDVYETCEKYMIDSAQLLMDQSCIYIHKTSESIKFVLNPLVNSQEDTNPKLKNMLLSLDFDKNEERAYVAELLQYFNRNAVFSLSEFSLMIDNIDKLQDNPPKKAKPEVKKTPPQVLPASEEVEDDEEDEKRGFFSFLGKKSKKSKTEKNTKKKGGFSGFSIPGPEDGGYVKGSAEIPTDSKNIKAQKVVLETYDAVEEDFGETELHRRDDRETGYQKVISNYEILRTSTGVRYPIDGQAVKIGRKSSIVDICILGNTHVGRLHAILYKQENGLFIEDNGSANGVFVGTNAEDNRIEPNTKEPLTDGAYFYLGDEEFRVCGK